MCAVHLFGWIQVRKETVSPHTHARTHARTHAHKHILRNENLKYFLSFSFRFQPVFYSTSAGNSPRKMSPWLWSLLNCIASEDYGHKRDSSIVWPESRLRDFQKPETSQWLCGHFSVRITWSKLNITFFLGMIPYCLTQRFPAPFV
jgi:hypothetical protein